MARPGAAFSIAFVLTAGGTSLGREPPPAPGAAGIPWASVSDSERRVVERYLGSRDWPVRVFGLLRLERFEGEEVAVILRRHAADHAWPVRCFALAVAHRAGIELTQADLPAGETDPRVIRAALRHGVALDDELVERVARRLLRIREIDALMIGIEIAAGSDLAELRTQAETRTGTLIRNMDGAVAAVVSRRLAFLLGLPDIPKGVGDFHARLRSQGGEIRFPAPRRPRAAASEGPTLVASMEPSAFGRLLDYLDILKGRDLDLAIVMDSTASMIPMVDEARAGVDSMILFLNDISRSMRLAFVAYRDHDNEPVWEGERFTTDVTLIRKFLFNLRNTGGEDLPEAVLEGLAACENLRWNPEATREIILIGDARPHDDDLPKVLELATTYRRRGIIVHSAHVPMEIAPEYEPYLTVERRQGIQDHNARTAAAFSDIAEVGGGRSVTLWEAGELVPAVMHVAIEPAWWPVFDEFYAVYLELCR